ncbi:MAG: hypothetical protein K8R02_00480 [Anaerohalosphaeraceae bacterium]|nr:hypothetical protein [Anaerohalosphaeraceae bacterium]
MAVVAPFSKYKKNNYKLIVAILVIAAVWFSYDGYMRDGFIDKHTDVISGEPDSTLNFHRKAPPFMLAGAVAVGGCFWFRKNKQIVAEDNEIVFSESEKISYDSIQSIDKTKFSSKGFFVIGFKDTSGAVLERKISDRNYDNLDAVLDLLVSKLKGDNSTNSN